MDDKTMEILQKINMSFIRKRTVDFVITGKNNNIKVLRFANFKKEKEKAPNSIAKMLKKKQIVYNKLLWSR